MVAQAVVALFLISVVSYPLPNRAEAVSWPSLDAATLSSLDPTEFVNITASELGTIPAEVRVVEKQL